MTDLILRALLLGLILVALPGPVFFALIKTSIERGFVAGIFVAVGIVLSDGMYITISYLGVSRFFQSDDFKSYLGYGGGIIMIIFGLFSIINSRRQIRDVSDKKSRKGYLGMVLKGLLINGVSPFVLIFWVGAVSVVTIDYNTTNQVIAFFAIVLSLVFSTDILKAYLANKLRTMVTTRFLKIMNIVVGIMLILFGGRMMFYFA
ncbi:MAG: LysE family transporter [Bacteroidota bacterium]